MKSILSWGHIENLTINNRFLLGVFAVINHTHYIYSTDRMYISKNEALTLLSVQPAESIFFFGLSLTLSRLRFVA